MKTLTLIFILCYALTSKAQTPTPTVSINNFHGDIVVCHYKTTTKHQKRIIREVAKFDTSKPFYMTLKYKDVLYYYYVVPNSESTDITEISRTIIK